MAGRNPLFDVKTLLPDGVVAISVGAGPRKAGGRSAAGPLSKASPAAGPGHKDSSQAQEAQAAEAQAQTGSIRTDDDVVQYFAESPSQPVKFFFCNRADQSRQFAPYDLVVVSQQDACSEEHFTISPREVLRFARGQVCEALPLAEWVWQKQCYTRLREKSFFRKYYLAKYYFFWWKTVRQARLRRTRQQLQEASFMARPAFCGPLLEIGALLARLREVQACVMSGSRVQRLVELVEQQAAWRERKARPEVEEIVGGIRKVAERACAAVEERAAMMAASVRDPSELEDRIGVDLYAFTTAARAKSMWVIKQEKIDKARAYHQSMEEVGLLRTFLRLVDSMLAEALADMALGSITGALRMLEGAGTAGGSAGEPAAAAAAAGEEEAAAAAVSMEDADEGQDGSLEGMPGRGMMLFVDVVFGASGTEFSPSREEWAATLEEQLVQVPVGLAAEVAPLASLPVFAKYFPPGEQPELTDGGAIARGSVAYQAACQGLQSLLDRSFADAATLTACYDVHRPLFDFHQGFDREVYTQKQRSELDLTEVRRDLATLQGWNLKLEGMLGSGVAGCIHVDARALRAALEPMAAGNLEFIKAMLLDLARDLCKERLEDLHLRMHVVSARPSALDDFVPWCEQVADVQTAKDDVVKGAATVDDCYDVLALYATKIPTQDQVKHDDLRECVAKLVEQLEGCTAFAEEQKPAHLDSLRATAKGVLEEAILLEESLKSGMYIDESSDPTAVVEDLEAVIERVAQLRSAADDVLSFQHALGVPAEESFSEVEDAHGEAQARLQLWSLVLHTQQCEAERTHALQLAQRKAALTPVPTAGDRPATQDSSNGGTLSAAVSLGSLEATLAGIAAEALRLEGQLAELQGVSSSDPVRRRAEALLAACKAAP